MRNIDPDSEENKRQTRKNEVDVKWPQFRISHPYDCPVCGDLVDIQNSMCADCENDMQKTSS